MVIIPSSCVGGRQSVPDMQVWDAVSSPPLPSKLQLSFHQQQWWECRLGSQEHFWKLFSQLLITGSNYKFLVGTLRRQLDIFERLFFFMIPEGDRVSQGGKRKMLKSHMLGTDINHFCPSGFFTSLWCGSALKLVLSSPSTTGPNHQQKYW